MSLAHTGQGTSKLTGRLLARDGRVRAPASPLVPLTNADREFLPAALEILATPPSPVAKSLLVAICGLFFAALAWSYFGWMDIYAVAPGKIQLDGGSKVLQSLEAGRIVAIKVENGKHVEAGDVLLELDPTESGAEREAQARDLEAASAEAARRKTAIGAAYTEAVVPPPIAFQAGISASVQQRETNVLGADLGALRSSLAGLKAQLAEKLATRSRLELTIAERQKLIALAKERVSMRQKLDSEGAGSRAQTIESLQQYEDAMTSDANDRGQLLETEAAITAFGPKIQQTISQFVDDQSQKLAEAEHKRDHLEQELIKAQARANHAQLKSPIAGTVQQLAVSSLGQVVAAGQPLLTVVPENKPLEVKALIANQDVGFVDVGQPAVVKVEAFPFTRYGTIGGSVDKVFRDAVDGRDAPELTDAANAARPQGTAPGSQPKTQDLVFPATIRLAQHAIEVDGKEIALLPGMAVTVEIKTGRRRVIDYLLSPLREVASEAGRER